MTAVMEQNKNTDKDSCGDHGQSQRDPIRIAVLHGIEHQSPEDGIRDKRVEKLPAGFSEIGMSVLAGDLG